MRPLESAAFSCDYAGELHPANKIAQRHLHLHILIKANDIDYFKNRPLYFLGDWWIVYVQHAHAPRKALLSVSRLRDAETPCYKSNFATLCEI